MEPVRAQDMDRAQTRCPRSPGWVEEQLLQTGSQATVGRAGTPRGCQGVWDCLISPADLRVARTVAPARHLGDTGSRVSIYSAKI